MNLLLKYGGPKANFAFGLLFVFASIAGVAGLIQHFTWRGAIAVVMLNRLCSMLSGGEPRRYEARLTTARASVNFLRSDFPAGRVTDNPTSQAFRDYFRIGAHSELMDHVSITRVSSVALLLDVQTTMQSRS
jgi:hypothetical protein